VIDKRILNILDDLKIEYRIVEHAATFTVADADKVFGEWTPMKSLLIRDRKKKIYLVIMRGDKQLNFKNFADRIGTKDLGFVSREKLMELFSVEPGSVSLFGLIHENAKNVEVIIDENIVNSDNEVSFHPNDNTKSIFFAAENVIKILDQLGNNYRLVDL